MRPDGIVVASPVLDQHLRLAERREDLAVQELISELRVQALVVAVLPRASRFDVERLDADPTELASYVSGATDQLGFTFAPLPVSARMCARAEFDDGTGARAQVST